jgi:hypothetical protein
MLTKFFKFMFSRSGAKQIEKLAKNDPQVRSSLINLHKAGNDLHNAMKKHEEEYGKYFK